MPVSAGYSDVWKQREGAACRPGPLGCGGRGQCSCEGRSPGMGPSNAPTPHNTE